MKPVKAIVTCEHGGNRVPSVYRPSLRPLTRQLNTHRGYDLGALPLAKAVAKALSAPLFASTVSRLLVDLNRSPHHPALYSAPIRELPEDRRAEILHTYYEPHRRAVEHAIESSVAGGGRVLHLGVHSFAPVLGGKRRNADVGLLYDPRRRGERRFCAELRLALASADPSLRVRFNYPYLGTSDGLATALRRRFTDRQYIGVEIEMNQRFAALRRRKRIEQSLVQALLDVGKTASSGAKSRP